MMQAIDLLVAKIAPASGTDTPSGAEHPDDSPEFADTYRNPDVPPPAEEGWPTGQFIKPALPVGEQGGQEWKFPDFPEQKNPPSQIPATAGDLLSGQRETGAPRAAPADIPAIRAEPGNPPLASAAPDRVNGKAPSSLAARHAALAAEPFPVEAPAPTRADARPPPIKLAADHLAQARLDHDQDSAKPRRSAVPGNSTPPPAPALPIPVTIGAIRSTLAAKAHQAAAAPKTEPPVTGKSSLLPDTGKHAPPFGLDVRGGEAPPERKFTRATTPAPTPVLDKAHSPVVAAGNSGGTAQISRTSPTLAAHPAAPDQHLAAEHAPPATGTIAALPATARTTPDATRLDIPETFPVRAPEPPITELRAVSRLAPGMARAGGAVAQSVSAQITASISTLSTGKIELHLQPAELGRLTIHLSPSENGVSALIITERPEVMDLLRRHGDMLRRDLTGMGFTDVSLDFQAKENGGRLARPQVGLPEENRTPEPEAQQAVATGAVRNMSGADGLDIRI